MQNLTRLRYRLLVEVTQDFTPTFAALAQAANYTESRIHSLEFESGEEVEALFNEWEVLEEVYAVILADFEQEHGERLSDHPYELSVDAKQLVSQAVETIHQLAKLRLAQLPPDKIEDEL